jgi:hypothetical protein
MYITPRVLIQQEFLQVPVYSEQPLPAFIIGPNYHLTRYSVADEKPFTAVGTYNGSLLSTENNYVFNTNTTYDFPNIPAGGDVDPSYTKVFAEAVEAQYFPLASLDSAYGDAVVTFVTSPSGSPYTNKLRFSGATLKTGNGHDRSSFFSNRDVSVNDVIEITDNLNNKLRAKIKTIEAETAEVNEDLASMIAPVIDQNSGASFAGRTLTKSGAGFTAKEASLVGQYVTLASSGAIIGTYKILAVPTDTTLTLDGSAPTTYSGNVTFTVGSTYNSERNFGNQALDINNSVAAYNNTVNATLTVTNTSEAYVGYPHLGILADTYTITVTSAGNLSNVKFSVASSNGAFALKTDLSLDAGVLALDDAGGNGVYVEFASAIGSTAAFVAGNSWQLTVDAEVAQTNLTPSGEYTGTSDMVYTVTVERGGEFFNGTNASTCARLLIKASDLDISSLVLPRANQAFHVGSYGVQAAFGVGTCNDGASLIIGDSYYIPVKAATSGAFTIVEISESLPENILQLSSSLHAKLFLPQTSVQIPQLIKENGEDIVNWTQEAYYITINQGITAYDPRLLTNDSTAARLPVVAAKLFVEHRDLLQNYVNAIDSVRDLADVATKLGTVHPDNPLAQGVYEAVLNAANQIVYFIGVGSNDLAGYTAAIKISEKSDKVYSFVPLTFDREIQDAVVAHVNAYSTPEVGRWRIAWISVEDQKTKLIYDNLENGQPYKATVTDDPSVSGVQNRLVTIEGARFLEDGVRTNDTIRINFKTDADGKTVYDEYVVDHVKTNTTLTITKSIASAIDVPTKVQVVRNYTKSERAYNIAHVGGDYNNRRVRCVFPDTYKDSKGVVKQGYLAAAGLAGLRSGVVPHQGLTNSEFLGAYDLSKTVIEFSQDDLNTMAEQGIWIISQEVVGATAYVRHQLTTDERSLNTSEDSITTNVDCISYVLKRTMEPFIGRYNINRENVMIVREAVVKQLDYFATSTYTARAGNQLVSFTPATDILRLEPNSTYKDRIDVEVRLNVPYPLNYLAIKLIVG